MARPTVERLNRRPGFGLQQGGTERLTVAASLSSVPGPNLGAQRLLEALGRGAGLLQNKLVDDAAKRTTQEVQQGQLDSMLGAVDEERRQKVEAYASGVYRKEIERQTREALANWEVEKQRLGLEDADPGTLVAAQDEYMREQLGDLADDPEAAAVIGAIYGPALNQAYVQQADKLARAQQERNQETALGNAMGRMKDGTWDYEEFVSEHSSILPRSTVVEIAVTAAVQFANNPDNPDENLIDQLLPDKITLDDGQVVDGPRHSGRFKEFIERGKAAAKAARLEKASVERAVLKSNMEKEWIDNPLSFDYATLVRELRRPDPLFSQPELISYYKAALAAEERQLTQADLLDFALAYPDIRLRTLRGALGPDGDPISDEEIQETIDRLVEREVALTGRPVEEVASAYTRREGYVYRPVANDLRRIPPTDAELWPKAVEQYFRLEPAIRELYVPDDEKRALFERSYALMSSNVPREQIGELLGKMDPNILKRNMDTFRQKWNKQRERIGKITVDGRGLLPDIRVQDLANGPAIAAEIERRAEVRVEMGADPTTAMSQATEEVLASYVLLPGPGRGKHLLLPRTEDVTDDFSRTVDWFYRNITSFFRDNNIDADPKKVRLATVPGSDQNTILTLVDEDGVPVNLRYSWTPATLERERMAAERRAEHERAQLLQRNKRLRRENAGKRAANLPMGLITQ